jgi:uncharacterized protein with GYD domain
VEYYVVLATFTVRGSGSGSAQLDELRDHARKVGARVDAFYLTLGQYDVVAVIAAPDGRAMAKLSLSLGATGNLRTTTLPAFSEPQLPRLLGQL